MRKSSPISDDFDGVNLLPSEVLLIIKVLFLGSIKEDLSNTRFLELYRIDFLDQNKTKERDSFNALLPDGTCSLTDRCFRYFAYCWRKLFHYAIWPAVVSGLVSLAVSYLSSLLLLRAIGSGYDDVTIGEFLRALIWR